DGAGRGLVPQPLQSGPQQGAAAVAVVQKAQLVVEAEAIRGGPAAEGIDLAGDGALVRLMVGRNAGVEGSPQAGRRGLHGRPPRGESPWRPNRVVRRTR